MGGGPKIALRRDGPLLRALAYVWRRGHERRVFHNSSVARLPAAATSCGVKRSVPMTGPLRHGVWLAGFSIYLQPFRQALYLMRLEALAQRAVRGLNVPL